MGVHCTFSFYYPKGQIAKALRTLESCCTPFGPNRAMARQLVLAGEDATVTSQPVFARYVGPNGYSEPMGDYEDGWSERTTVDFDALPAEADGVSVMYTTTVVLRDLPVLPGSPTDWHRESEGRGEFTVLVTVHTQGAYGVIDFTSSGNRMNEYFLRSQPVRARALAFARATSALLALEDCEGPYYELTEEPTWSGGHEPDQSWRLTTTLRAFGALPGAG